MTTQITAVNMTICGFIRYTKSVSTRLVFFLQECLKYSDNCCNATTCKLHPGLECDTGPCCGNCKVSLCHSTMNSVSENQLSLRFSSDKLLSNVTYYFMTCTRNNFRCVQEWLIRIWNSLNALTKIYYKWLLLP